MRDLWLRRRFRQFAGNVSGQVLAAELARDAASASATLSQAWAEGTLPGGPGTKSAKEWAGEAEGQVALAQGLADDAAASAASVSSIIEYFPEAPTTNLANPAQTDALMATSADQIQRLWNNNSGSPLSIQSPTLPTFAALKRLPVVAGQTYTISMNNALGSWFFYFAGAGFISFFNANGTWNSAITSGFTRGAGDRSVTFTVPAGAAFVAFNVRNISIPVTAVALDGLIENLMFNTGGSALDYAQFLPAGSRVPDADAFASNQADSITVVIQRPLAYVRTRCQNSSTTDIVMLVLFDETPASTGPGVPMQTGIVDFVGARFIPSSTSRQETPSAYNTSTQVLNIAGDQRAPIRLNDMFLGGGHGLVGTQVTQTAHGKTTADHGSVYQDSALRQWVLTQVVDANTLRFTADNTGDPDKWVITSNFPTGTVLTHVSGGTNTATVNFTSPAQIQLCPMNQMLTKTLVMDGNGISTNGVYSGNDFRIHESYTVPNCAALLTYAKANVGITDYTTTAISGQVAVSNDYQWNRWGAISLFHVERCLAPWRRSVPAGSFGGYSGSQQFLRFALVGDSIPGIATSVWAYVPNTAPVGGVDYKAIANITSNASFVIFPKASADNPADPPSHFANFARNGSNATLAGLAWGYHRKVGLGIPANRAANVTNIAYLSPSEKSYPIMIDSGSGDAVAGEVNSVCSWQSYFLPTDPTLSVPAVVYSAGGKHYAVITSHQSKPLGWVNLPNELIGLPVSVLKSDPNVTLQSDFVSADGVLMTFASSYGDVILEIG